jgi:ATP-dependent RNA helicase RhlE
MNFDSLGLSAALVRAVAAEGYSTPTPIQAQAIPHVLAGRDVLGCAQTGTGKTAAFALPIIHKLSTGGGAKGRLRCLVVTPTRELANQIGESFQTYGRESGLRHAVIFGGVGQDKQVAAVRRGIDILVATPGRLLDLLNQRLVSLQGIEILVLDEADRMLDMGFIRDVKKIIAAVPKQRQTLFFSATMPSEVQSLVDAILTKPVKIEVAPVSTTAERVEQRVYHVGRDQKRPLIVNLLQDSAMSRVVVFTRTKNGANRLTKHLQAAQIGAEAIHGNKSQNARERALDGFKTGQVRVLVATDIAARGIDVEEVSHVVNYELPNVPETYVHRIGRTGRAGAAGIAISLCDHEERAYLRDIERTIRQQIEVVADHPYKGAGVPSKDDDRPAPRQQASRRGGSQGGRPGGQQRSGGRSGGGGRSSGGGRGGGRGGSTRQSGSAAASSQPAASSSSAPARPARPSMPRWY